MTTADDPAVGGLGAGAYDPPVGPMAWIDK